MRRHVSLLFFLGLIAGCDTNSNVKSPDKSYFVKYFGSEGNQHAVGLIVNSDGTFFILGNSREATSANQKIYLAQADAKGNLIWQTTYGNAEMDAKDFVIANGSIVVAANRLSSPNNMDVQLVRFSLTGDTVQSKLLQIETYLSPTPKNEWATSLTLLNDGGFVVAGYTDYGGSNAHLTDALHFRMDANFNQKLKSTGQWVPASGGGLHNYATKAFQVSDSTFIFGYTDGPQPPSVDDDFWAFELDSKGGPLGVSVYVVNNSIDVLANALKATQGGYLLSGVAIDNNSNNFSLKVSKIRFDNLSFDSQDIQYTFPGRSLGTGASLRYATACNSVAGYFVLTNTFNSAGTSDMMLVKLDVTLQEAWKNPVAFGGDGDDTAAAVAELADGHIMVLGTMNLGNPPEQFKIALIKLNAQGQLSD